MVRHPHREAIRALNGSPIFANCSDSEAADILRFTDCLHLEPNQILMSQDQACSGFFLLISGHIKLYRSTSQGERVIGFAEPGDSFAEAAVFCGEGYPYCAVALDASDVLAFQAYPLSRFMQSNQRLTSSFLACLSRNLRRQTIQRAHTATYSADQRLASFLLGGPESINGDPTPARRLPGRRRDLANLLAMTPETLCRALGRFRKSGWIEERAGYVTVTAQDSLNALLAPVETSGKSQAGL